MESVVLKDLIGKPLTVKALNDGLPPNTSVKDARLSFCLLQDKHLKESTFDGGRITHCRFEHCNLRKARFLRVDLTATWFSCCDLEDSSFDQCELRYTTFHQCRLDYDNLLRNAPSEPNLKRRFLESLRLNAISMGDTRRATELLVAELAADRHELISTITGSTAYYRNKYSGWQRVGAVFGLVSWWLQKLIWGHGLALWNVVASGTAIIFAFAVACRFSPAEYLVQGTPVARKLSFSEGLYYSLISFTTGGFGDIMPGNVWARAITGIEGLFGVIFLAFFAAAAYRRLAR